MRTVSVMMLTLLTLSMLTLAFDIQPVKAGGTIYIRADGSIDLSDAPIARADTFLNSWLHFLNSTGTS